MKFRYLIAIVVVIGCAFVLQQLNKSLEQWDALQLQNIEALHLAQHIERLVKDEKGVRQKLVRTEHHYAALRRLLPKSLQVDEFEQQIEQLAAKHKIKILAGRTSDNSQPGFKQAILNITFATDYTKQIHFMRELKSIPRRIHIVPDEKRGKKNVHMLISVYAVPGTDPVGKTPPKCVSRPEGVVMPPFSEKIATLYDEYLKHCRYIEDHADIYNENQRLLALKKENRRLEEIEEQLRRMPQ